jgi:hypothetical protein
VFNGVRNTEIHPENVLETSIPVSNYPGVELLEAYFHLYYQLGAPESPEAFRESARTGTHWGRYLHEYYRRHQVDVPAAEPPGLPRDFVVLGVNLCSLRAVTGTVLLAAGGPAAGRLRAVPAGARRVLAGAGPAGRRAGTGAGRLLAEPVGGLSHPEHHHPGPARGVPLRRRPGRRPLHPGPAAGPRAHHAATVPGRLGRHLDQLAIPLPVVRPQVERGTSIAMAMFFGRLNSHFFNSSAAARVFFVPLFYLYAALQAVYALLSFKNVHISVSIISMVFVLKIILFFYINKLINKRKFDGYITSMIGQLAGEKGK